MLMSVVYLVYVAVLVVVIKFLMLLPVVGDFISRVLSVFAGNLIFLVELKSLY